MKKCKICLYLSLFLAFIIALNGMNLYVYSFFFSAECATVTASTGSVRAAIDGLRITNGTSEWSEQEGSLDDGQVSINSSVAIYFSVLNEGKSAIEYELDLAIGFNGGEIASGGKLFAFPLDFDDEYMLYCIEAGYFEEAIAGASEAESGEQFIYARLGEGQLERFLDREQYGFRLFFYQDYEITQEPEYFHEQYITIGLTVSAALYARKNAWANSSYSVFEVMTEVAGVFPVLVELEHPKIFHISKSNSIDFSRYAAAFDEYEGDISDRITISVSPSFSIGKAGTYRVRYDVRNSQGLSAAPLYVTITVWDFVKIESGFMHTLALTSHGRVYAFGYNAYGQLGDGTNTNRNTPKLIEGLEHISDIASGFYTSYALDKYGQVYSWGRNSYGEIGNNTLNDTNLPTKVVMPSGVAFTQISSSFYSAGAVSESGEVYTWGNGDYGVLGNGSNKGSLIPKKIALSNIAKISIGSYAGAAITRAGSLYTWGDNLFGELGNGQAMEVSSQAPKLVPFFVSSGEIVTSVSAGYSHMLATTASGKLYSWGGGEYGKLGNGSTQNRNTPQLIALGESAVEVNATNSHSGVLTSLGNAYFFGNNNYGKLGNGNTNAQSTPVKLASVANIRAIAIGYDNSFVLDGVNVYGFGYGGNGSLGTGNNYDSLAPIKWAFTPPSPQY